MGDRNLDKLGRVIDDAVLESFGEPLRDALHLLLDRVRGRNGVGARLLRDDHHGGGKFVLVAVGRVVERPELDATHVLHPDDATVPARLEDDILEFARLEQAPLELERELEGPHVLLRRLAERAAGNLNVLRAQRRKHLVCRHAAQGDALGIEPHAH